MPRLSANFSFSSLKAGCLLAGVGLGLLVGFIISVSTTNYDLKNWGEREMVSSIYGASVLLFGGIGLIIAFLVEMKITKDKEK